MNIWAITDGSAGMKSQVQGVGEALGGALHMKTCALRAPFGLLPATWSAPLALKLLSPGSDALLPPWPDVLLTSGRRAAAFSLAIKRASGGKTFTVHLTDPRISPAHFDLVVAMEHDALTGPNVISTRFALHKLTAEALAQARARWEGEFSHLPRPWIAVLIGGSTNKYTLTPARMERVIAGLAPLRAQGSLLITPSRRTGEENVERLRIGMGNGSYLYNGHDENPYLGLLALSDYIVVTDDSVNMMSEAAFTGKPLYILPLPEHTGTKPARFAQMLVREGVARLLGEKLEIWPYAVPDERERVATSILACLKASGKSRS